MSPALLKPETNCQVAIVGGGIAGLTLALAFERVGISFVLFEAHESITPDKGASVGLLPNGLRILDQLGVLEDVEKHSSPLKTSYHIDENGELILAHDGMGYYRSKLGYGGLFLERRKVLQMMYDRLQSKHAIRTSARVTSIQSTDDHVTVVATDGSTVTADLVVGADGVRSCVRKFINLTSQPEQVRQKADDMYTNFACVYGISSPMDGILQGDTYFVYRKDAAIIIFTGKDGVLFWFVLEDLGRAYPYADTPCYTSADVDVLCQSVASVRLSPTVRFKDVYANRSIAIKVPLEEGMARTWHTDRMVIVGDAAHKMLPTGGMGANQAMESSVSLVNELRKVLRDSHDGIFPRDALRSALARYSEQRRPRAGSAAQIAGLLCRSQMGHDGPAAAMRRELPSISDGDFLFRGFAGLSDAPVIDGIEPSSRGHYYNQEVRKFWQKVKARREGSLSITNSQLFGLAACAAGEETKRHRMANL